MPEREPPSQRDHDTYAADHWTVVDVGEVDIAFATDVDPREEGTPVRIDFDGFAASSVLRDVGEEGDNINVSAWFSVEYATELRDQLTEAIERAKEQR